MRIEPELIFHDVDRADWIVDYVRRRVARLDRLAGDLISCHVTLSREQGSQRTANNYRVKVEARLPPQRELAAVKARAVDDPRVQLRALVRRAFEALERQLKRVAGGS